MPPPRKQIQNNPLWYENAYLNNPDVEVHYEMDWHGDMIRAGDEVKIKYERGVYKFRCLVFNTKLDTEWIDVLGLEGMRSFYPNKLKGPAKKRSRRRKKNV